MSKRTRRPHASEAPPSPSTLTSGDLPDEAPGHRQARLEHVLHDELQSLLRDEVADPALEGITVLAVQLSPDAGHARVAYAVAAPLNDEREARLRTKAGLARATGFLRARLAQQLDLRKLPAPSFTFVGLTGGDPCHG